MNPNLECVSLQACVHLNRLLLTVSLAGRSSLARSQFVLDQINFLARYICLLVTGRVASPSHVSLEY